MTVALTSSGAALDDSSNTPSARSSGRTVVANAPADLATSPDDPAVTALAAVHRTGDLVIGDAAVIVAVAASHRDVAFAACRRLIDDLKAEVPIWKHQSFSDGGSEWVGAH